MNEPEADGFDLVDIGMHNYAIDTDHAPLEFAIVVRVFPVLHDSISQTPG